MTPRIAPFTPTDAPVIASWVLDDHELRWLAPKTLPPLTPDKIAAWRNDYNSQHVLRADAEPLPIAYAEISRARTDPAGRWLGHVIVAPCRRGRGLGAWFVDRLLDVSFADPDASCVSLVVFPDNHAAIACYERCGFRFTRDEIHRFGPHAPRCRLRRFDLHRAEWRQFRPQRPVAASPDIECHTAAPQPSAAADPIARSSPQSRPS